MKIKNPSENKRSIRHPRVQFFFIIILFFAKCCTGGFLGRIKQNQGQISTYGNMHASFFIKLCSIDMVLVLHFSLISVQIISDVKISRFDSFVIHKPFFYAGIFVCLNCCSRSYFGDHWILLIALKNNTKSKLEPHCLKIDCMHHMFAVHDLFIYLCSPNFRILLNQARKIYQFVFLSIPKERFWKLLPAYMYTRMSNIIEGLCLRFHMEVNSNWDLCILPPLHIPTLICILSLFYLFHPLCNNPIQIICNSSIDKLVWSNSAVCSSGFDCAIVRLLRFGKIISNHLWPIIQEHLSNKI